MTETDKKNTTRSTLTLKLKPASDSKTLSLKGSESKRSSSAVQVTIKGRKRDSKGSPDLNNKEIEARFNAISGTKKTESDTDHDVLGKIIKANKEKGCFKILSRKKIEIPVLHRYRQHLKVWRH